MAMNFEKMSTAGGHAATLDFTKAVEVASGERIDFTKANPGVTKIRAEIYWESDSDGDISAVLLNASKVATPRGIVYYDQPELPGVTHSGDCTGDTDGDPSTPEETMKVDLNALTAEVDSVLFIASTYPSKSDPDQKAVPFGLLRDCKVLIVNDETSEVLYGYELDEDYSTFTSVELCSFYRKDGGFRMTNMGTGVGNSAIALNDIAAKYGL